MRPYTSEHHTLGGRQFKMADTNVYPGQTKEAHPELFDIRAMPEQPPKKLGQLPENAIRQFFEEVLI